MREGLILLGGVIITITLRERGRGLVFGGESGSRIDKVNLVNTLKRDWRFEKERKSSWLSGITKKNPITLFACV